MATINGPDVRCQECGRWEDDYKADLVRVPAERDTYRSECASISTEFGLPATIRPAEGEIGRFMDRCKTAEADLARVTTERDAMAKQTCDTCAHMFRHEWSNEKVCHHNGGQRYCRDFGGGCRAWRER